MIQDDETPLPQAQDELRKQVVHVTSPEARREQVAAARARLAGDSPRGRGRGRGGPASPSSPGAVVVERSRALRDEELRAKVGQVEQNAR